MDASWGLHVICILIGYERLMLSFGAETVSILILHTKPAWLQPPNLTSGISYFCLSVNSGPTFEASFWCTPVLAWASPHFVTLNKTQNIICPRNSRPAMTCAVHAVDILRKAWRAVKRCLYFQETACQCVCAESCHVSMQAREQVLCKTSNWRDWRLVLYTRPTCRSR